MFRPKSEAIQVGVENTIVPCRNGQNFQQDTSIYFDIPRNIGFANLKNARILVSVRLDDVDASVQAPYIPDRIAGAQCFIKKCTIRSNGVILEEMNNYNLYAKLYNSASADSGVENVRSRTQGCMKSNKIQDSPYHVTNPAMANNIDVTDRIRSVDRQVEIPILGGIFQNENSFPLLAMPLEVELLMEKARLVLTLPDSANSTPCEDTGGATISVQVTPANAAVWGPLGAANEVGTDPNNNIVACCPYKVGQTVRFTAAGGNTNLAAVAVAGTPITNIKVNAGTFIITCGAGLYTGVATAVTMFSLDANGNPLNDIANPVAYTWKNPRLLVPRVIPPPDFAAATAKAIQKGKYAMDILSFIDYMNAIDGNNTRSTNLIPADLSRVKAINSVPINVPFAERMDTRNYLTGQSMGSSGYIFQLNNILIPSRECQLTRENYNPPDAALTVTKTVPPYTRGYNLGAVHGYELEKSLQSAGIPLRNLTFISKNATQMGCWAVGRSLGPYGTSQNLMAISTLLYLNYDTANPLWSANLKLLHNFVSHIRTLEITPQGVVVRY